MTLIQQDLYNHIYEAEGCPKHLSEIKMDICQDYQMQGNAEFVPRVIEEELAESWILQCKACENMHGSTSNLLEQPEMILE